MATVSGGELSYSGLSFTAGSSKTAEYRLNRKLERQRRQRFANRAGGPARSNIPFGLSSARRLRTNLKSLKE